jgi:hypothetical protein
MRKLILILTLVALLLVFPLAANAAPPNPNQDDGGWGDLLSDFAEQVTEWYTEVFNNTGSESIRVPEAAHVSIAQEHWRYEVVQRLNALMQAIRYDLSN